MLNTSFNLNLAKIKDFAKSIQTPESTVRTWIRRKDIPQGIVFRIGNTYFINVYKFNEWTNGGTDNGSISKES